MHSKRCFLHSLKTHTHGWLVSTVVGRTLFGKDAKARSSRWNAQALNLGSSTLRHSDAWDEKCK